MASQTEIVIRPGGAVYRRTFSESEIRVTPEMLESISTGLSVPVKNLFTLDGLIIGLSAKPADRVYTVPLAGLSIKTRFRMFNEQGAQRLIPSWVSDSDPIFTVQWPAPSTMRLLLLIQVVSTTRTICESTNVYLLASENPVCEPRAFRRLPLPNLYEDCRMCEGEYDGQARTDFEAVEKVYRQLIDSPWNSDLLDRDHQNDAQRNFFRWSVDADKFTPIYPVYPENWQSACPVIGLDIFNRAVL